jgi:hypothetical protein
MLNDLAVFKAEDIHDRRTTVTGFEDQVTMQDHVIAFRDDPFWFHAQIWKGLREPFHSLNKRFGAISCAGIVLPVVRSIKDFFIGAGNQFPLPTAYYSATLFSFNTGHTVTAKRRRLAIQTLP